METNAREDLSFNTCKYDLESMMLWVHHLTLLHALIGWYIKTNISLFYYYYYHH